nr:unnamed protein product [Digitaria exilis]
MVGIGGNGEERAPPGTSRRVALGSSNGHGVGCYGDGDRDDATQQGRRHRRQLVRRLRQRRRDRKRRLERDNSSGCYDVDGLAGRTTVMEGGGGYLVALGAWGKAWRRTGGRRRARWRVGDEREGHSFKDGSWFSF